MRDQPATALHTFRSALEAAATGLARLFACVLPLVTGAPRVAAAEIRVDAAKVLNPTSPLLYGACIEDVNHEIYGGLYGQLLYGESFEEPARQSPFKGWMAHGGDWRTSGAGKTSRQVHVTADRGAKIVRAHSPILDATIEFDVRFIDQNTADSNAGLITRVRNAATGADAFDGYEISLAGDGKSIVLGRHQQNWQLLQKVSISVAPSEWQHLAVTMKGERIRVYVNSDRNPVIDFTDSHPLPAGSYGLRTWGANAELRNLETLSEGKRERDSFTAVKPIDVSGCWDPVLTGAAKGDYQIDPENPYNTVRSQRIRFTEGKGSVGVANRGLNRWGISVVKDAAFDGRVYLRGASFQGEVTVSLQDATGSRTYASQKISGITDDWKKHPIHLTADVTDPAARFAISIDTPGTVWIDQAVLMKPATGRFKGLPVREDIANAMVDGGLTFIRYGGTAVNAPEYRWKSMVGDPDLRPQYKGHWHPHTTNGFGIIEFVAFCERAGVESAFAINAEETPEDMADMIEYFNGDTSTKWGKARAEDGHPEPYAIKYVEIGNEEVIWGDIAEDYDHYIERFKILAAAMRAKDPNLEFINAAWWRGNNPNCERVLKELDGIARWWDFHTWADNANSGKDVDAMLTEAEQLFQKWVPGTKTKVVIFEENGNLHNHQRALGHATTLNAVRRHGDFVRIDCEANGLQPWKQNDNGWDQGHVFFTPSQVWGMPPYYAQQMASRNHLPLHVDSEVTDSGNLDVTATKGEDGRTLCLHVVNLSPAAVSANIVIEHFEDKGNTAKSWTLSGSPEDANSPGNPERIKPVENTIQTAGSRFTHRFPPHSHTVLRLGD